MRLRAVEPPIPLELVDALETCNIRTDYDLIFSASTTDIIRRLPPGTISQQALDDLYACVLESASAVATRGCDTLSAEKRSEEAKSVSSPKFGVELLDAVLRELGHGHVLEISGDKGSAKSVRYHKDVEVLRLIHAQLLALNLVLQALCNDDSASALWVDTTGDFSAETASRIAARDAGQVSSAGFAADLKCHQCQ
jgi:RAD51-like protein 3